MKDVIIGIALTIGLFMLYGMFPHRGCTGHCAGCDGACGRHDDGGPDGA